MSCVQSTIDLDAYFRRIGSAGGRTPTLETLQDIVARHTEAIPFENLNPLLRWPVPLDAPSLEGKIVRGGRGGYCFEQNLLLSHVLSALGYRVTGLAARVLWNAPEGAITPRGHMLLRVDLGEQPFVVDVGFGGLTLTGVIRLEPDCEQPTPHEPFRLIRGGEEYIMQANLGGVWKSLYRFDLQPQFLPDYEVTNWYLSNHPNSYFINGLIAARAAPNRRYNLRNNEFAVHYLSGRTERRILSTAAELREALEDAFRLTLPEAPELEAALERLTFQPADQAGVIVQRFDILSPAARTLIEALNAELSSRYPEEGANHFRLDPDEVADGRGAFLIASRSGKPVGCGAVRSIEERTGEIKRMYVRPEERGRGVGRALLAALEAEARALGICRLVLETGVRQSEAITLYQRAGFSGIAPFGEYVGSPLSLCMAKEL